MDKKDFYGVRLNNYFSPSFCSSHKMYFGTLNDIKAFIERMGSSEQSCMIRNTFERYLSGKSNATHEIAYVKQKLIDDVELIAETEVRLGYTAWEFLNVWHYTQYMEIDSAVVKMALIKYEERYLRVIKVSACGLRTCVDINRSKENWLELSDGFWGHPGVLSSASDGETYVVYNNLYMKEKRVCNKTGSIGEILQ